jgi:hypothetical protein
MPSEVFPTEIHIYHYCVVKRLGRSEKSVHMKKYILNMITSKSVLTHPMEQSPS